jgi:ectoine hydroxylase-related dioxygenase (phytanoyl-CoA dioxygenase family)
VDDYRRDGYLVVRGALAADQTRLFQRGLDEWSRRWKPTGDSYETVLHQDHLAWRQGGILAELTRHAGLAALARTLSGLEHVRVFLDQVVVKPAGGAPTIAHQDAPFLSFDDQRSLNCWIALDEIGTENGALAYYRGSHELGRLPRAHLDEADVLGSLVPSLDRLPVQIIPMRPGDVVFHNCLTVHKGFANATDRPRRAFSIQYMSTETVYNGYESEFLRPYRPVLGQALDFPCFAVPDPAPTRSEP